MTERDDWQTRFRQANSFLKEEKDKMLLTNGHLDANTLFSWLEATSLKAVDISPVCTGGYLSLMICDDLSRLKDGPRFLKDIIEYAGKMGIKSEVDTDSLRYQATVCISIFLDQRLKNLQIEV